MDCPNILVIVTDQLSARALGKDAHTPAIDRIRDHGVRAQGCFCQFPLCQPSRASMWSGVYPHKTEVLSNGKRWPVPTIPPSFPTLGNQLKAYGYHPVHFGKKHDAGALAGFACDAEAQETIPDADPRFPYNMDTYADAYTHRRAVEFLRSYQWEKPLCMIVDFINPHNICGWVGKNKGIHDDPPGGSLPQLPPNYRFDDINNRSRSVQYICCSHVRQSQTVGWTDTSFRWYLAAYNYYLELADWYIQDVLGALDASGHGGETMVLFTSDHGDNITARGQVTKQVNLYEECVGVPFFACGPGIPCGVLPGLMESLDIAPTILGLCGIPVPPEYDGLDLSENLRNLKPIPRAFATSQWHTEWGFTVSPSRMIRTEEAKYIRYLEDGFEEYYDLVRDPYEMHNAAQDNPEAVKRMRCLLDGYVRSSGDPFWSLKSVVPETSRNHPVGYQCHKGLSAPEL